MAGFFTRGILLEQHKEPALSRDILKFLTNSSNTVFDRSAFPSEEDLTSDHIIEIARLANIVDERDGIPLYKKLVISRDAGVNAVIGDASDDEPYISSQISPLLQKHELVAYGMRLACAATGADNQFFVVYKNLVDIQTKIPSKLDGVPVKRIRGRYPADFRITDKFIQYRPVLVIGACSLIHLARAVLRGRMQTTCFITVAGNCVSNPRNFEVSLGMPVMQVLERCGLSSEPNCIVLGGPMTGISCKDPDHTVVMNSTRAILAFYENVKDMHYQCIGCGRCVDNCPENLTPFYLNKMIEHGKHSDLRPYDLDRCIGCGICSYVCPANIDVAANIKEARDRLPKRKGVRK